MIEQARTEKRRAFDMALDIEASPDEVWRALTEAEELVRWFPLEAHVTPGPGGRMVWSWGGEAFAWETRIDGWEPGRLLRLVQDDYQPSDEAEPARIAIEFTLESRGGKTRLRLVHSGFGRGAAWDNELDSISEGWPGELGSLRLYLERHRGRDRQVGLAWLSTARPRDAAWETLIGPGGFGLEPVEPVVGRPFAITTSFGDRFTGTVVAWKPRQSVTGTVRELDDGLIRLTTWRDPRGKASVWVSLATYSGDAERVGAFQKQARQALERLFPDG